LPAGSCVEVEQGENELLTIEAFCCCGGMVEDFWGVGRDWVFPPVLGCARLATLHDTADAAFRAYRLGHPDRPQNPWRQTAEVKASFYGLDLREIEIARADQILENLEDGRESLGRELRRIERKGGQGALLSSSCGGIAVLILDKHFDECVEFGQVVEFEPDRLVP
jgi:hypothetical protein